MIKEIVKYPEFSAINFIRLYCAVNYRNGCSPIIKHHELEKKLYKFYLLPEYEDLFQDICPKEDYINPENSYLDLGTALNTAQLFGLLTPIHDMGEISSISFCDEEQTISKELILNEEFINSQVKKYNELLKSTIVQEIQESESILVKKKDL